jgi:DNA polymerase-3 subunit epsilon
LLSDAERYEDAATHRDRLAAFVRTAARMQRLEGLSGCQEMVAARPGPSGSWELALVRHGRLAGTSVVPVGVEPRPWVEALLATGEAVEAGVGPLPASTAEETECILRWLDSPGVRLVRLQGAWASPARGAGGLAPRYPSGSTGTNDAGGRPRVRSGSW